MVSRAVAVSAMGLPRAPVSSLVSAGRRRRFRGMRRWVLELRKRNDEEKPIVRLHLPERVDRQERAFPPHAQSDAMLRRRRLRNLSLEALADVVGVVAERD